MQPARHYVTQSRTHWLPVPGGQDTAASGINPFLSIPSGAWVTQRDLHGAEHWPPAFGQSGGAFWGRVVLLQELGGSSWGQIQPLCSPETAARSRTRASELNQVFTTCVGFGDGRFMEGLVPAQPSHHAHEQQW